MLVEGVLGAAAAGWYRDRDFSSLYHGARLVTQIDVYEPTAWCRETRGSAFGVIDEHGRVPCPAVFLYPLWTAVVLLPLGLVALEVAASIWLALSIAAAVIGAWLCWRAAGGTARWAGLFTALVFGGQPFWLMVGGGQMAGILLLGVGLGAFLVSRGHQVLGGGALALLALKPHVLGLHALALLARAAARHDRGFIAGAVAAVSALFLISVPFQPGWPIEWLGESFGRQTRYSPQLATAWGFAAHDLGNVLLAPAIILVVLVATIAIARGIPKEPVALSSLAVPLSLFATPYAWSYDFLPLALCWAFILSRAGRAAPGARRLLLAGSVLVASPLGWLLYGLAFERGAETLSAMIPALAALLTAAAIRSERTGALLV